MLATMPDTPVNAPLKPEEVSSDFIIFYLVSLYWYTNLEKLKILKRFKQIKKTQNTLQLDFKRLK